MMESDLDTVQITLPTKNEFNKMVYDYNKNMLNILRDMEADASVAQRASRYAASKNNPIELDRK